MVELVPHGWSARRFSVVRDGEAVAELQLGWVREGGEVTIDGAPYELRREGLMSGAYRLTSHRAEVARARKPSAWRNRLEVEHDGWTYELAKRSWWGSTYELRLSGSPVGEVRPRHLFTTRRAQVHMPDDMPLPTVVFVCALVVLLWNRESAAASG
jgi:hypothetical protein